jgi:PelA/Pel-15E family pectate lyase
MRVALAVVCCLALCTVVFDPAAAQPPADDLRAEAQRCLKKAVTHYRDKVASRGGYLYYYTPDLKRRWGEGEFNEDTIFVQPPGTPTVGMAYLQAWAATGDVLYLDAAREAAEALVYGQLQSGGWTQAIHFGPAKRVGKYRNGKGGSWNVSSLDDGQTQAALKMLMLADQAFGFKHAAIHEAAEFGLDALLKAQFANGGFPQVWQKPVEKHPVVQAKYPDYDWKTEGRVKSYWDYYTLNDNLAGSLCDTLITAHLVYREERYKAALEKLGDFLILAQMPDPQPGWCQQYNYEMFPIWGRKFEPAAITGWESQDVMEALIYIAAYTGKTKYLEPIPKALAYFKKSLLPDGRVARFYEFKTNKPLYMDAKYELTYDDSAAPSHYGWKQPARFAEIERAYQAIKCGKVAAYSPPSAQELEADVRRIVKELNPDGQWISTYDGERLVGQPKFERGFRYLSSEVFARNVGTLSRYLRAGRR